MSSRKLNQNRYTRKQEERRQCDALLQKGDHCSRRTPCSEESLCLLEGIRKNKISEFGVVKLSHVGLDALVQSSGNVYQSLLSYAVECGRDKIAIALLRAGADPSMHKLVVDDGNTAEHCDGTSLLNKEDQVNKSMSRQYRAFPGAYVIWLMRFALQRIQSTSLRCDLCSKCPDDSEQRIPFKCYDMISFDECNHIVCNSCFWGNIHLLDCGKDDESGSDDIMSCKEIERLTDDSIYCLVCNNSSQVASSSDRCSTTCDIFTLAPSQCKLESFKRWSELPITFGDENHSNDYSSNTNAIKADEVQRKHKEQILCAIHLSRITMLNLGCSQQQRSQELFTACEGRGLQPVRRIIHLIQAGVDIDCINEYGLSPLHVAAWLGNMSIVRLLLAAGANVSLCDPLSVRAHEAAHAAGHVELCQLLKRHEIQYDCADEPTLSSTETTWPDVDITAIVNDAELNKSNNQGLYSLFKSEFIFTGEHRHKVQSTHCPTLTVLIPPKTTLSSLPSNKVEEFWSNIQLNGIASGHNYHGAEPGAFCFDHCFSPIFLHHLLYDVFPRLPVALCEKKDREKAEHCATRSFFCDLSGKVVRTLHTVICDALHAHSSALSPNHNLHNSKRRVKVFPQLRFLHYKNGGSALPPHVDLARLDVTYGSRPQEDIDETETHDQQQQCISTHTLILYLSDCERGGETALLRSISKLKETTSSAGISEDSDLDVSTTAFLRSGDLARISPRVGRLLLFPHKCPHEGLAIYSSDPKVLLRGEVYIDPSSHNSS